MLLKEVMIAGSMFLASMSAHAMNGQPISKHLRPFISKGVDIYGTYHFNNKTDWDSTFVSNIGGDNDTYFSTFGSINDEKILVRNLREGNSLTVMLSYHSINSTEYCYCTYDFISQPASTQDDVGTVTISAIGERCIRAEHTISCLVDGQSSVSSNALDFTPDLQVSITHTADTK